MNYFNTLSFRDKLKQIGTCSFLDRSEFTDGITALKGRKIVIVGCGAQGLNQGLNLRDSGLDVSYALRSEAISQKRASWKNATENGFTVGTYEELIPQADLVINLTPDKQHSAVVSAVMPLMKKGSALAYSHGFNVVEEGMQIRSDITVIMVSSWWLPRHRVPRSARNTSGGSAFPPSLPSILKTTPKAVVGTWPRPTVWVQAVTGPVSWLPPLWQR